MANRGIQFFFLTIAAFAVSGVASQGVFKMASGGGTNCNGRSDCAGYIEWTVVGDTIRFTMESSANWIALGISADQRMGTDGIDDVLACQRDPANDNVFAKDTYNPQDQSTRGNSIDSNQDGLTMTSGMFDSGRLRCVFTREIVGSNAAEDRNLNESAFLLMAMGAGRAAANMALTPPHSAIMFSSDRVVLTDETAVTTPDGVFKMASGGGTNCKGRSDCAGYVDWTVVGNTIRFTMESSANWIALGISADQSMGTDGIDDVLACQRDPVNDNVYAKDCYNPQDQSSRGNSIDSNQDGLTMTSGMFDSGRLRCVFTREIVASNAAEDRNLNEPAFLLMAIGAGRAAANAALTGGHSAIMISSGMVVLTGADMTTAPPSNTPSVFRITSTGGTNCNGRSDCAGYVEWTVVDDTIRFSMESSANWIALGLSADQRMGTDGIDDVLGCQRDSGSDNVFAKDTYNPRDQSSRGNSIDGSQTGLTMTSGSFTGGRLRCVFTREIAASDAAEDRNLNESAFLLLAIGAGRAAATVGFTPPHSARTFSSERVTLTQETVITTSCVDDVLTRLHGALMYIAWGFLVPIALFFPAFMRPNFGKGEWFKIHLVLMLIALPISLIGLLFIIVAHRNSDGRIALGSENGTGTAHFVFGIVIIILQVANPIIAIFRCKPKSKNRWIFNLIHKYLIGYPVETFAWVSMGLGFARLADIRLGGNFNILWLYIAVAVAFGLLELVGGFGLWILCSVFKKDDDGDAVKMTKDDEKVQVPDSPGDNKTEPKKDWLYWLRWALFGIGATILVCGGIAILVLIFIGLSC